MSTFFGLLATVVFVCEVSLGSSIKLPREKPIQGYGLVEAFPGLHFEQPVGIVSPPDETNQLFIVERGGRIQVVPDLTHPSIATFLDLSDRLLMTSIETGLLGLAFHPGYKTNRQFFVYSTRRTTTREAGTTAHLVLSRFLISATNPLEAESESETVLFAQDDRIDSHNGGDLQFGPDGYLYVTVGEHGPGLPLTANQSRIDAGLYGLLRIDVDRRPENLSPNPHSAATTEYSVPRDNPFVGVMEYLGETLDPLAVRTELYAVGLRNPWRMHFDTANGNLYVADVGGEYREEIDLIRPGVNYGWPYWEAEIDFGFPKPQDYHPVPPLYSYAHGWGTNQGNCIIGGVVYHGKQLPNLEGAYLFGDYSSGHIWALPNISRESPPAVLLTGTRQGLSTFALDPRDGEVLLAQLVDGVILKLVYQSDTDAKLPRKLSETGAFDDLTSLTPNHELTFYEINAPFWSDNAIKRRWISLPEESSKIEVLHSGDWSLPTGTIFVKHFDMETVSGDPNSVRRIETRFLVKTETDIYGLSYRWLEDQSDALLVDTEGVDVDLPLQDPDGSRIQRWRFPSRSECQQCHSQAGGYALGFNAAQLNHPVGAGPGSENLLAAWNHAGWFNPPLTEPIQQRRFANMMDPRFPLEYRVRSYLESNCVGCHNPTQPSLVAWNAQMTVSLTDAGITDGHVVAPGKPELSWLLARLVSPREDPVLRMPPLVSSLVDSNAAQQIEEWIREIPQAPWIVGDLTTVLMPGSSTLSNNTYWVSGAAATSSAESGFQWLSQPFSETSVDWVCHVQSLHSTASDSASTAKGGLLVRSSRDPAGSYAGLFRTSDGSTVLEWRSAAGAPIERRITPSTEGIEWLQLMRNESNIQAWGSRDGTQWIDLGSTALSGLDTVEMGLASTSDDPAELATAQFDQVGFVAAALTLPQDPSSRLDSQPLRIVPAIRTLNLGIQKVEVFANGDLIGQSTQASADFWWPAKTDGNISLTASITHSRNGALPVSYPDFQLTPPAPTAAAITPPAASLPHWKGAIGTLGYRIAGVQSIDSTSQLIQWSSPLLPALLADAEDPRALDHPLLERPFLGYWKSDEEFVLNFPATPEDLRRVTTYSVDMLGGSTEQIEWRDPVTKAILDSQVLSSFESGRLDSWWIRGSAELHIRGMAGSPAWLSAVFLDPAPNTAPQVSMISPARNSILALPTTIRLIASPTDQEGVIQRVDFLVDDSWIASSFAPPWAADWTNAIAGTHQLKARAYDSWGAWSDSDSISITLSAPAAAAGFVGADTQTRGDWVSHYGTQGWNVPDQVGPWPVEVRFEMTDEQQSTNALHLDDIDLLRSPDGTSVFQGLFVSPVPTSLEVPPPFHLTVEPLDGSRRLLSLYFYNPNHSGNPRISLRDSKQGGLLDVQTLSHDAGGTYLTWSIQGAVQIEINGDRGKPYLTGVFLDPDTNDRPRIALIRPVAGYTNTAPAVVHFSPRIISRFGIRKIEYFANGRKIGEALDGNYEFDWAFPAAGSYQVSARATDLRGRVRDSIQVPIQILPNPQESHRARARFLGVDRETAGLWIESYGTDGWKIASFGSKLPAYATLEQTNTKTFTWFPESFEPRALLRPDDYYRMFATWYADTPELNLGVSIQDGQSHRTSLYFASFFGEHHTQIDVVDSQNGQVLDSRVLDHLSIPAYASWEIEGKVQFRMKPSPDFEGFDAVWYSGVFFDPGEGAYGSWKSSLFTDHDAADPTLSGPDADPDGDGLSNRSEFALGTDPNTPNTSPSLLVTVEDHALRCRFTVSRNLVHSSWVLESSSDLKTWLPISPPAVTVSADDRWAQYSALVDFTESSPEKVFIRLRYQAP